MILFKTNKWLLLTTFNTYTPLLRCSVFKIKDFVFSVFIATTCPNYSSKNFTAKATDWKLFLRIHTMDAAHARGLELKIKSMKSSKYIQNLLLYPELIEKIYAETSQD
jgi:hypothetical protein